MLVEAKFGREEGGVNAVQELIWKRIEGVVRCVSDCDFLIRLTHSATISCACACA